MLSIVLAGISAAIWLYLLTGRGMFWLGKIRDDHSPPSPVRWPSVAVIIPARNEAAVIGQSVCSLLRQDYAGALSVIVVDDDSDDGTGVIAQHAAEESMHAVAIIRSASLPAGWTGKLWALRQGVNAAERGAPEYLLLTDADIVHAPESVSGLWAQAGRGRKRAPSLTA